MKKGHMARQRFAKEEYIGMKLGEIIKPCFSMDKNVQHLFKNYQIVTLSF